jgi:adenylosuccinate synthase
MLGELDMLRSYGIEVKGLKLAGTAHVTMPYHRLLDQAMEERRGDRRIGTTGRGIGPTYADKSERNGIRVIDLLDTERLRDRLLGPLAEKNDLLQKVYGLDPLDPEAVIAEYASYGQRLAPHVVDCTRTIHEAARARKNILFEGAQGTLLDLDHGTYPYVTSSNPVSGGACIGAGVGPTLIDRVIGVAKAYTTRVGSGPFPTELFDASGEYLSKTGGEVGVTTGRQRRCGWFDAVIARYATRVNGITDYFLTKLDVLSSLETVPVCVGYTVDGKRTDDMPMTQSDIARAVPVYEELPGWWEDISGAREFDDLPTKARDYVLRLEELAGAPVSCIGVGPGRDQTIVRRDVLAARS